VTYYRSANRTQPITNNDQLKESYDFVFDETKKRGSFDPSLQMYSAELFDRCSSGNLVPKKLRVDALVLGLKFSEGLRKFALEVQGKLDLFLATQDRYWVMPENLASEILVLKWPDTDNLCYDPIEVMNYLNELKLHRFYLHINGAQVHSDGAVILRGYDNGFVRSLRQRLHERFPHLPAKQSQWVHIPLGRIVSQVASSKFGKMIEYLDEFNAEKNFNEEIIDIKLVQEYRWYMTEKEVLFVSKLI